MVRGLWTGQRHKLTLCRHHHPPPVPFEGARVQRERITRTDFKAFGTTAGSPGFNAIRSGKRAEAHSNPCRVKIEGCLKTTPEGSERLESKKRGVHSQIEVERNVRRREDIGSTAGELAVPQELQDMPIPPDSDLRKTCHEGSDTCEQWQLTDGNQSCRLQKRRHSKIRRQTSQDWMSRRKRDESISSKAQNTGRRLATKTPAGENKIDETMVAVTTQESLDGIREKAMRNCKH